MISIGKFLSKDDKFYDLLEASAQQADTSVHHLVDLLAKIDSKSSAPDLAAFAQSRREDKRITQELTEERSEEHTSELQSHSDLVCRLLLEKKKKKKKQNKQDQQYNQTT